jgi:hypothetical protein
MNVALWIVQSLLAALFLGSAYCKGLWSRERLVQSGQTGVRDVSYPLLRFIAFAELFGAVGLVLPWALGVAPVLTPLAAIGLGIIMVLAAGVHARLREPGNVAKTIALLAACLFVAVGRGITVLT